jgi:hypothetical protein
MHPLIPILIILTIVLFNYLRKQRTIEKHNELKNEYTELLKKIKPRENLKEYNESKFWELVDKANKTAGNNYNNKIGVMKTLLTNYSADDLIEIDNLLNRLISSKISHTIIAASQIIFKTSEFRATTLLMNLFILKGDNYFQYACQNPELIVKEEIIGFSYETIGDIIEEKYKLKTNELLPTINIDLQISGTPLSLKDYPIKLPKIWEKFG